jgi:predicted transcriptional regulator
MQIRRLTHCELEIMDVVWRRGEATVQEVCDGLARPLAYTTVMTTLSLLERKKKVLRRQKRGRAYVYQAVVSRDEVSRSLIGELRDLLFGGSTPSLVLNLVEDESVSKDDIRALQSALKRLERRK